MSTNRTGRDVRLVPPPSLQQEPADAPPEAALVECEDDDEAELEPDYEIERMVRRGF